MTDSIGKFRNEWMTEKEFQVTVLEKLSGMLGKIAFLQDGLTLVVEQGNKRDQKLEYLYLEVKTQGTYGKKRDEQIELLAQIVQKNESRVGI